MTDYEKDLLYARTQTVKDLANIVADQERQIRWLLGRVSTLEMGKGADHEALVESRDRVRS